MKEDFESFFFFLGLRELNKYLINLKNKKYSQSCDINFMKCYKHDGSYHVGQLKKICIRFS